MTIPTNHRDGALDNTGFVPRPKGLRVVEKKVEGEDRKVMQAALGFTEPDVKGKVQRGTIPDCSAGIFFDWLNKHQNKRYRSAMKHVSLTPTPFMGNLDPFPAVFASDPDVEGEVQVQHFMFDDGTVDDNSGDTASSTKGDIVWNETASFEHIRNTINAKLNPKPPEVEADLPLQPRPSYYARDISREDTALVDEFFKGDQKKWIIPFTHNKDDGSVEIAPATRWVEAKEAMIAATDVFDNCAVEGVKGKLIIKLAETFGDQADKFGVSDLSLDRRIKVVNNTTGAEYVAGFTILADDSVVIEPTAYWERTKAPAQPTQAAPNVKLSDEPTFDLSTPRGRLEAARQQRRQRKTA